MGKRNHLYTFLTLQEIESILSPDRTHSLPGQNLFCPGSEWLEGNVR